MAIISIIFPHSLNVSIQPTDILYATDDFSQAGVNSRNGKNKPRAIGKVNKVIHELNTIEVDTLTYPAYNLSEDNYLFFSKSRSVNMSGILGYYALTEYRNHSKNKAEIFATGAEYAPSSK